MSWVIGKRKHEKIVGGFKVNIKGMLFENEVADYFSVKGCRIKSRERIQEGEVDVATTKSKFFGGNEVFMMECKHKRRISLSEFT